MRKAIGNCEGVERERAFQWRWTWLIFFSRCLFKTSFFHVHFIMAWHFKSPTVQSEGGNLKIQKYHLTCCMFTFRICGCICNLLKCIQIRCYRLYGWSQAHVQFAGFHHQILPEWCWVLQRNSEKERHIREHFSYFLFTIHNFHKPSSQWDWIPKPKL